MASTTEILRKNRPGEEPDQVRKYELHRCTWTDPLGNPDGYSYAAGKAYLLGAIHIFEKMNSRHSDIKVVEVNRNLYNKVMYNKSGCITTKVEIHPGDLSPR